MKKMTLAGIMNYFELESLFFMRRADAMHAARSEDEELAVRRFEQYMNAKRELERETKYILDEE